MKVEELIDTGWTENYLTWQKNLWRTLPTIFIATDLDNKLNSFSPFIPKVPTFSVSNSYFTK